MKKSYAPLIGIAMVLCFIGILALPFTRDELSWRWAGMRNSIESYAHYLKVRPNGRHAAEAVARQDDLTWKADTAKQTFNGYWHYAQTYTNGLHIAEAQEHIEQYLWDQDVSGNTVAGYEDFLSKYGSSKFAPEARTRLEELKWQQAKTANTLRLLDGYIASYPQGKHMAEAQKLVAALKVDDKPLNAALTAQSATALQTFLKEYPGHSQETEARQALKDLTVGRDILELIADKKLEAYGVGTGAQEMQVKLKKLTPGALVVRIPVGTYLAPDFGHVQNMVVREERQMHLEGEFWTDTSVPVVSMNFSKDEPDFEDSFRFQRLPQQSPVAPLVPVLQRAGASFPVWQAAFWIATDNTTYDHMGSLTEHPNGDLLDNVRMIQETEAARALKLCEEAGIDITQKKIWKKNRAVILNGLKDPELKQWMESKPEPK